ncbi:hypothetical protein, partial [Streptomyces sp. AK02-01A]|uniref:hypothetical protein n=1 Tax=Streptomyces sp. AK02-01A TaxID=3028648 RepID=UPI0029BC20BD
MCVTSFAVAEGGVCVEAWGVAGRGKAGPLFAGAWHGNACLRGRFSSAASASDDPGDSAAGGPASAARAFFTQPR